MWKRGSHAKPYHTLILPVPDLDSNIKYGIVWYGLVAIHICHFVPSQAIPEYCIDAYVVLASNHGTMYVCAFVVLWHVRIFNHQDSMCLMHGHYHFRLQQYCSQCSLMCSLILSFTYHLLLWQLSLDISHIKIKAPLTCSDLAYQHRSRVIYRTGQTTWISLVPWCHIELNKEGTQQR